MNTLFVKMNILFVLLHLGALLHLEAVLGQLSTKHIEDACVPSRGILDCGPDLRALFLVSTASAPDLEVATTDIPRCPYFMFIACGRVMGKDALNACGKVDQVWRALRNKADDESNYITQADNATPEILFRLQTNKLEQKSIGTLKEIFEQEIEQNDADKQIFPISSKLLNIFSDLPHVVEANLPRLGLDEDLDYKLQDEMERHNAGFCPWELFVQCGAHLNDKECGILAELHYRLVATLAHDSLKHEVPKRIELGLDQWRIKDLCAHRFFHNKCFIDVSAHRYINGMRTPKELPRCPYYYFIACGQLLHGSEDNRKLCYDHFKKLTFYLRNVDGGALSAALKRREPVDKLSLAFERLLEGRGGASKLIDEHEKAKALLNTIRGPFDDTSLQLKKLMHDVKDERISESHEQLAPELVTTLGEILQKQNNGNDVAFLLDTLSQLPVKGDLLQSMRSDTLKRLTDMLQRGKHGFCPGPMYIECGAMFAVSKPTEQHPCSILAKMHFKLTKAVLELLEKNQFDQVSPSVSGQRSTKRSPSKTVNRSRSTSLSKSKGNAAPLQA